MSNTIKKPSDEWVKEFPGLTIMDPDGWDRSNFIESWAEPIDEIEFHRRVMHSTICVDRSSEIAKKMGIGYAH